MASKNESIEWWSPALAEGESERMTRDDQHRDMLTSDKNMQLEKNCTQLNG